MSDPITSQAAPINMPMTPSGEIEIVPPSKEISVQPSVLDAFSSVFRGDQGYLTLLMGAACFFASSFIPIVPVILYSGYLYYLVEQQIRYPDRPPLKLDLEQFSKLLSRGIWPFLVQFLVSLVIGGPLALVVGVLMFMAFAGGAAVANEDEVAGVAVIVGGAVCAGLVSTVLSALMNVMVGVMGFKAGMGSKLGDGFDFGWVFGFIRANFFSLFLSLIVWTLITMMISVLGLLVVFVGVYVAQAWSTLAFVTLMGQYYRRYLTQGGVPIRIEVKNSLEGLND